MPDTANMIACNSVDSSADNNISEHHFKYCPDAGLGNYGMNHLNSLLEHFSIPIRNAMTTIDDQLCKNEFKQLLAYIENQNRFTGCHPGYQYLKKSMQKTRTGETTDTYFLLCLLQCCIISQHQYTNKDIPLQNQ